MDEDLEISEIRRFAHDEAGVASEVVGCVMDAELALLPRAFEVLATGLGLPEGDAQNRLV